MTELDEFGEPKGWFKQSPDCDYDDDEECHPDAIRCCAPCLLLNGYDVILDEEWGMIDTDKYEGHTPAPWMMGEYKGRPSIYAGDETFVRSIARGLNPSQTADHALLLDAPLLLAEVERLREGRLDLINEVIRIINNKTGERVDADLHDYIIDRLVNE
jgi:hypothetical protein